LSAKKLVNAQRGEILVIEDDIVARETLSSALRESGYEVTCFADGAALLSQLRSCVPVCVFLEARMNDRSRLDLLKKLRAQACPAPIFITSANDNTAMAVEAIKNGAFDFIAKPFSGRDVVNRVDAAIKEVARIGKNGTIAELVRYVPVREPFTHREREVLARIVAGETNKEMARRLSLSPRTIEGHRANIMRKVGARNAAELLRLVLGRKRTDWVRCTGCLPFPC
jgi:FixJ family two-component response regulator